MKSKNNLTLTSALSPHLRVRRIGPATWTVNEPRRNNHHVTRLIRIDNPGKKTAVTLRMTCANPAWVSHVYVMKGRTAKPVAGTPGDGCVRFTFDAPPGVSHVGPEVWHTNEDGDRFINRMCRSQRFTADAIGHTLEGRPIRRLTLGDPKAKHVVVIAGREHATEPSGSFAVEAVAEYLLDHHDDDPLYRDCRFDLIPIVNPDGVARGEAYPQAGKGKGGLGQFNPSDPHYCGMVSDDPTVKAWRDYLFAQRPDVFANYHAYWAFNFPQVIFYDKRDGMAMLEHLIDTDMSHACSWYVKRQAAEQRTMMHHCVKKFGTVVSVFELPWRGNTIQDIQTVGVRMFLSTMEALRARNNGNAKRKRSTRQ